MHTYIESQVCVCLLVCLYVCVCACRYHSNLHIIYYYLVEKNEIKLFVC